MSIDIAAFEAVLPDPEVIRAAAAALVSAVGDVVDTAEESATAWGHLQSPDVYDIAGSEVVFNAFRPVTVSATDLDSDVGTVDTAVLAYADTVDALKLRLDAVKADAANFFSRTRGRSQDDWDDDEGLIQAEQNIIGDLNRLYSDLQEAQRVCANAISAIYGGPKYVLTTEEGAGTGEVEFGFSGEQLDAAAVEGNVPWGQPTEWDKPWYRDAWDGVASFGKGVWSGVTGTVTGLGNMVGLGGAEAFEQTWKGLGNLAVNLVIMTTPAVQIALHASGNSDRVRQAGDELLAVGKAAIHWDEWQTDPAYAAGATSFDLASILLTAGAGATAKVGSVAGKIGDVANASGKVSAVVNASGIGKVAGVTVKVTDAAQAFKINAITTVVDTSRVTVGKVGDAWQAADQFVIDSSKSALDSGRAALNSALNRVDTVLATAGHGRFGTPALAGAGGAGPRVVAFTPDTPPARTGGGSGAGSSVPHSAATPDAPVRTNVPEPSGNGRSSAPDAPVRGNGTGAESPSGKPGHAVPEDRTPSGRTTDTSAPAGRVDGDDTRAGGKGDEPAGPGDHGGGRDDRPGRVVKDETGQPTEAVFRDGTRIPIEFPKTTPFVSALEELRPGLERLGRDEDWMRRTVETPVEDLTTRDLQDLMELRHSIPEPDRNTVMQKIIHGNDAKGQGNALRALLEDTNPYGRSAGGYISKASHVANLRTPEDVYWALRLDYKDTPYFPNNEHAVYAIQFRTNDVNLVQVPDGRAQDALVRHDAPTTDSAGNPYPEPHIERLPQPNMGSGYTGSMVDDTKVVPEYSVEKNAGAVYHHGAVIWEINKTGERVLVAIFDSNKKGITGKQGMWRRVLSSVD
ncbi:hypothetical protein GCM10009688_29150 [Arthrobacter gandavensis]|uniref:Uncharacterized protein n=1 Tax=Arthrobacter gandavensis TaxID=169960 RepID=A0ABN2PHS0_9MICC|nr:hypothetical protein [Arthrobacter citreus]